MRYQSPAFIHCAERPHHIKFFLTGIFLCAFTMCLSDCASAPVVTSGAICPQVTVWSKEANAELLSDRDDIQKAREALGKPRFGEAIERALNEYHVMRKVSDACHATGE